MRKVSVVDEWTECERDAKPLYAPHPRRLPSKCEMPASASRTVRALARRDLDSAVYCVRQMHAAAGSCRAWRKGVTPRSDAQKFPRTSAYRYAIRLTGARATPRQGRLLRIPRCRGVQRRGCLSAQPYVALPGRARIRTRTTATITSRASMTRTWICRA